MVNDPRPNKLMGVEVVAVECPSCHEQSWTNHRTCWNCEHEFWSEVELETEKYGDVYAYDQVSVERLAKDPTFKRKGFDMLAQRVEQSIKAAKTEADRAYYTKVRSQFINVYNKYKY